MATRAAVKRKSPTRAVPQRKRKAIQRAAFRDRANRLFVKERANQDQKVGVVIAVKQSLHQIRSASAVQKGNLMKSSVIKDMVWVPASKSKTKTNTIWAQFKGNNKWYSFPNQTEEIYKRWFRGDATCTTDDWKKHKRYWIGKHPSLGAFYNEHLRIKKGKK